MSVSRSSFDYLDKSSFVESEEEEHDYFLPGEDKCFIVTKAVMKGGFRCFDNVLDLEEQLPAFSSHSVCRIPEEERVFALYQQAFDRFEAKPFEVDQEMYDHLKDSARALSNQQYLALSEKLEEEHKKFLSLFLAGDLYRAFSSPLSDLQEFPEGSSKPKALFFFPEHSHNQAFADTPLHLVAGELEEQGHDVVVKQVGSLEEIKQEMKRHNVKIDTLVIGGHGSPHSITLGDPYLKSYGETEITFQSALEEINHYLAPESLALLYSCSTGHRDDFMENMADYFLGKLSHLKEVRAPKYTARAINLAVDREGNFLFDDSMRPEVATVPLGDFTYVAKRPVSSSSSLNPLLAKVKNVFSLRQYLAEISTKSLSEAEWFEAINYAKEEGMLLSGLLLVEKAGFSSTLTAQAVADFVALEPASPYSNLYEKINNESYTGKLALQEAKKNLMRLSLEKEVARCEQAAQKTSLVDQSLFFEEWINDLEQLIDRLVEISESIRWWVGLPLRISQKIWEILIETPYSLLKSLCTRIAAMKRSCLQIFKSYSRKATF